MVKFSEMVRVAAPSGSQIINYIPSNRISKRIRHVKLQKIVIYIEKKICTPLHVFFIVQKFKAYQILVCDHSDAHVVSLIVNKKVLIFCHDLFAIQAMQGRIENIQQNLRIRLELKFNLHLLTRASKLIAISYSTQKEIIEMIPRADVLVISPTVLPEISNNLRQITSGPYCLLPMNEHWRKNRIQGIQVYSQIRKQFRENLRLVIIGNKLSKNELETISRENLENSVLVLTNLSETQMQNHYKFCEFVIFTTKYEGFGLPIIEANYFSRIAIHSGLDVLNEVGGARNVSLAQDLGNVDWPAIYEFICSQTARFAAKLHYENHYSFEVFSSKLNSALEIEPRTFS